MVREPLYQRIERSIRNRWASVGLLLAIGVPAVVLLAVESIIFRSWLPAGLAAFVGFSMVILSSSRVIVARRQGRAMRDLHIEPITSPSRWPALDRACVSYSIRTGLDAPITTVSKVSSDGTRQGRVDAELIYLGPTNPESGMRLCRSPHDAQAGDDVAICFDEPMLSTYEADELLAVIVHLMERAALWAQATVRVSNGACEADGRALLITHDHAALLRALEKCDLAVTTLPPWHGLVRFSDLDMTARKRAGDREAEWDSRSRLTELREHLMAAGLDVPPGGSPSA